MRARSRLRRYPLCRTRGFGLVEILVGVTIGLIALLIIYQAIALSEGYRRTTMAGGDAQSSGMISSFVLASDVANGGHTISESASELASCPNTGNFATTWRPIPVLITDGGSDEASDTFGIFGGINRRLVSALDTTTDYAPGGNITVQSPLGYHRSHGAEAAHAFVISDITANRCEVSRVSPWPAPVDAVTGITTITPSPSFTNPYAQGVTWIVNLGPNDRVRKVMYSHVGDAILRTDLLAAPVFPAPAPPNPIVSNIVLMKAQYGVDTNADTFVDTWVSARNPPWRAADVLAAPLAQLRQIKAIRIAIVVRSTQFERPRDAEGRVTVTDLTSDFTTPLFPCNGLPGCTGEMPLVTIPNTANYRYRVYEQVIPLTNQIWNAT